MKKHGSIFRRLYRAMAIPQLFSLFQRILNKHAYRLRQSKEFEDVVKELCKEHAGSMGMVIRFDRPKAGELGLTITSKRREGGIKPYPDIEIEYKGGKIIGDAKHYTTSQINIGEVEKLYGDMKSRYAKSGILVLSSNARLTHKAFKMCKEKKIVVLRLDINHKDKGLPITEAYQTGANRKHVKHAILKAINAGGKIEQNDEIYPEFLKYQAKKKYTKELVENYLHIYSLKAYKQVLI